MVEWIAEVSASKATSKLGLYDNNDVFCNTENQQYSKRIHSRAMRAAGSLSGSRVAASEEISQEYISLIGIIASFGFASSNDALGFARQFAQDIISGENPSRTTTSIFGFTSTFPPPRPQITDHDFYAIPTQVAIDAIKNKKTEEQIGIEVAKAAWNEVLPLLEEIKIRIKVIPYGSLKNIYSNKTILDSLREPLNNPSFDAETFPEIRAYYVKRVQEIEKKI
jgi:hypothetical protein